MEENAMPVTVPGPPATIQRLEEKNVTCAASTVRVDLGLELDGEGSVGRFGAGAATGAATAGTTATAFLDGLEDMGNSAPLRACRAEHFVAIGRQRLQNIF